uniref:BACK domain-containing protein n=1 Tax=Prymnesium polylepis TaxID=72548 RepID=A0A7S4JIQ0_9EUKA
MNGEIVVQDELEVFRAIVTWATTNEAVAGDVAVLLKQVQFAAIEPADLRAHVMPEPLMQPHLGLVVDALLEFDRRGCCETRARCGSRWDYTIVEDEMLLYHRSSQVCVALNSASNGWIVICTKDAEGRRNAGTQYGYGPGRIQDDGGDSLRFDDDVLQELHEGTGESLEKVFREGRETLLYGNWLLRQGCGSTVVVSNNEGSPWDSLSLGGSPRLYLTRAGVDIGAEKLEIIPVGS